MKTQATQKSSSSSSCPPTNINPTETDKWMAVTDTVFASPVETVLMNNMRMLAIQMQQVLKVMNDVLINTDKYI